VPEAKYQLLRSRLDHRLDYLMNLPRRDADVKRLYRHRLTIFTFLNHSKVPSDNNQAEREI